MKHALQVVILAAGHGTRLKSDLPKVLHSLGGRPMVHYALDLACQMKPIETVLVVSPSLQDIQIPFPHKTVVQHPAQGTGDAVKYALPFLKADGHVLILYGDTPLIKKATLEKILSFVERSPETSVTALGMRPPDKQNYARLLLNEKGNLEEIIEDKDASPSQKEISLCNSGVMLVRGDFLREALAILTPQNAAKEYYLTDLVKIARQKGNFCQVVEGEASEFIGVNSRQDLAFAEACLQNRWREKAMREGVTLLDPQSTYLSYDTQLAQDVTLHPHVVLGPGVKIEKGAEILSFCRLSGTHVGGNVVVGPFAHLRDGVYLQEGVEIGNFVEVKKSTFGPKAKAKHLSYIGDTEVGAKANIGAGTITCNYDGHKKHKTKIGEGVFIGSNCSLIAPLSIGEYAIVAAGSVVTEDVKERALAIGRALQTTVEKGADRLREKILKKKEAL